MKKPTRGGRVRYDVILKDLFQQDHPSLLDRLTGGVAVRESLNVEFAAVQERRADLVLLLQDDSIFHLDFQSENDGDMAYREGIYGLMVVQKYRRQIRQTVLYTGPARMHMPDWLSLGEITVAYSLVDIREFDAESLLKSGRPGDYALALLAQGGPRRLREILEKAGRLQGPQRAKVLAQLVELSGLRQLEEKVTMELKTMRYAKYVDDHVFLREIRAKALAEGEAKGRAEGKAEGKAEAVAEVWAQLIREFLQKKFGPLPKWVLIKVDKATPAQLERWVKKVLTAESLDEVVGKR